MTVLMPGIFLARVKDHQARVKQLPSADPTLLTEAELCYTDTTRELELSGMIFDRVTFSHCDFRETDFSACKFKFCHFDYCDFGRCNFSKAILLHSRFNFCSLESANLSSVTFSGHFQNCDLDFACFHDAHFEATVLGDCELRYADFTAADLSHVRTWNCDWDKATLVAGSTKLNWSSHLVLGTILLRAARTQRQHAFAAYCIHSPGVCWDSLSRTVGSLRPWAVATLKPWIKDGDNHPRKYFRVKEQCVRKTKLQDKTRPQAGARAGKARGSVSAKRRPAAQR